jgi:hypothetical protein
MKPAVHNWRGDSPMNREELPAEVEALWLFRMAGGLLSTCPSSYSDGHCGLLDV